MSARVLDATQLAAMRAGRDRARNENELAAVERVRTYTAWLRAGSNFRTIPALPTDADYAIARRRGIIQ